MIDLFFHLSPGEGTLIALFASIFSRARGYLVIPVITPSEVLEAVLGELLELGLNIRFEGVVEHVAGYARVRIRKRS